MRGPENTTLAQRSLALAIFRAAGVSPKSGVDEVCENWKDLESPSVQTLPAGAIELLRQGMFRAEFSMRVFLSEHAINVAELLRNPRKSSLLELCRQYAAAEPDRPVMVIGLSDYRGRHDSPGVALAAKTVHFPVTVQTCVDSWKLIVGVSGLTDISSRGFCILPLSTHLGIPSTYE